MSEKVENADVISWPDLMTLLSTFFAVSSSLGYLLENIIVYFQDVYEIDTSIPL